MNEKNLRDHGYPDMGDTPVGKPKAEPIGTDMECPNCGCQMMKITVEMTGNKLIKSRRTRSGFERSGKGTGTYLGCPAYPFASPMVTVPA